VGTDVTPAALAAILLSSGATKTVTVTLAEPAPAGGLCVTIAISNPAVATVTIVEDCIPEGQQTVSFVVTALAAGEALITVTAGAEVLQFHLLEDPEEQSRGCWQWTGARGRSRRSKGQF
jgi:hypothetical protein